MKLITKMVLGASALLLSANVMAGEAAKCPSVATIKASQFAKAQPCSDGDKNYWCMVSNNFTDEAGQWNVAMLADIDAKDPNAALRVGQDFFQSKVSLNEPEQYGDSDQTVCLYGMKDYEYAVAAFNPPIQLPGSEAEFRAKLAR